MTGSHRQECSSRDLAVGWALHALEPEEEARFAEHLPRCVDCTDRVTATEDMAAVLAVGVEQVDPPARLREAVLAAARTPQVPRAVPAPEQRSEGASVVEPAPVPDDTHPIAERRGVEARAPRTRRVLVGAVAAVALAFGAGWVGSSVLPDSTTTTSAVAQLSDPSVHRTLLTGAGTDTVYAAVLTDSRGASVVPVDMGSPPSGRDLYLWGTGSGDPVLLGQVEPGSGAAAQVSTQGRDTVGFSGYAVSSEPAGTTPTAPSVVVATSTV